MKPKIFISEPVSENPILDKISKPALIAWFRCNSCLTCRFREEVIDQDPDHDIYWCSRRHEKTGIVDMVRYFGYKKE